VDVVRRCHFLLLFGICRGDDQGGYQVALPVGRGSMGSAVIVRDVHRDVRRDDCDNADGSH